VGAKREAGHVVVLESFGPPHERTNPYSTQLFASFPDRITPTYFTWGRALRGDYDVFHLHWPEVKVRGTTPLKSFLRGTAFLLVLLRIRLGRRALVRTLHDLTPHEPLNPLQAWVVGLGDRWTTLWITLNDHTLPPEGAESRLALIGHYRDWYPVDEPVAAVPGRMLHCGLIRRYKGVDSLLDAFTHLPDPDLTLRVVGKTFDEDSAEAIRRACASDARITAVDEYVPDDVLTREVLEAELVVLPFIAVTNSSSLLLALSLGRPVLVSSNPTIEDVAEEVGPGWVITFRGELDADVLADGLRRARGRADGGPDLSRREWPVIGEIHAQAFERACELVGR
jgi:beta-1,4-mannosyltransferase